MHNRMQEEQMSQANNPANSQNKPSTAGEKAGEYIDFEEVK